MAWKRSPVRSRPGPPNSFQLLGTNLDVRHRQPQLKIRLRPSGQSRCDFDGTQVFTELPYGEGRCEVSGGSYLEQSGCCELWQADLHDQFSIGRIIMQTLELGINQHVRKSRLALRTGNP
jgi:hypothetical protein